MNAGADDAPALAPGLEIDDRYRLDQIRHDHHEGNLHAVLWRAQDASLGRAVAILTVTGGDRKSRKRLTGAATVAGRVTDSRFVRVLDVGSIATDAGETIWVATEWVDAPSLAAVVRDEPLPPPVATEIVWQCADAVVTLQRDGLGHGWLHPDQVLLPEHALPRITGLQVGAELRGPDAAVDDVQALGALLFAALTGRWPLVGWSGLPLADPRAAQAGRPRLVHAGIGRELDEVTRTALSGGYADARAMARALAALPRRPVDVPEPPPVPPGPTLWQRWSWRVVPPAVVLAIGIVGWAVGSELGRVPSTARQPHLRLPPATASGPDQSRAELVWSKAPLVTSFDPEGDGTENDDATGLAVDRDPTTFWSTSVYRDDPHFGGLKSGVGILLDLGRPRSVRLAELALTREGATVELRAGNQQPNAATDLPVVASTADGRARTRLDVDPAVNARFWLVWFTSVPREDAGYGVGVAEVALLG
jgi:hypothetical protein